MTEQKSPQELAEITANLAIEVESDERPPVRQGRDVEESRTIFFVTRKFINMNKDFFRCLPTFVGYKDKSYYFVTPYAFEFGNENEQSDDSAFTNSVIITAYGAKNEPIGKIDLVDVIAKGEIFGLHHPDISLQAVHEKFDEPAITTAVRATARERIIKKVADHNGHKTVPPSYECQIKADIYLTNGDDIFKICLKNANFYNWESATTEQLIEVSQSEWEYDPKLELPYELRELEKVFLQMMEEIEASNDFYRIQPESSEDVIEIIKENQYYRKYQVLTQNPNRLKIVFDKVIHEKFESQFGLLND